jgi:hypothetical protein
VPAPPGAATIRTAQASALFEIDLLQLELRLVDAESGVDLECDPDAVAGLRLNVFAAHLCAQIDDRADFLVFAHEVDARLEGAGRARIADQHDGAGAIDEENALATHVVARFVARSGQHLALAYDGHRHLAATCVTVDHALNVCAHSGVWLGGKQKRRSQLQANAIHDEGRQQRPGNAAPRALTVEQEA